MVESNGIPAMGLIFMACAFAFLEWLAWSRWALALVFGSLLLVFGVLFWFNLANARDARRIADAMERAERRERQQRQEKPKKGKVSDGLA